MPLPSEWTQVTVTGTFTNRDGTPAQGWVTFESRQIVTVGGVVIVPKTITAALDGTGQISVQLPSTNDPALSVTGWGYIVTEHIPDARPPYTIEVPYSASSIDLGTVPHAEISIAPKVLTGLYATDIGVSVGAQVDVEQAIALSSQALEGSNAAQADAATAKSDAATAVSDAAAAQSDAATAVTNAATAQSTIDTYKTDVASAAAGKGGALVKYKRLDTGASDEDVTTRLLSLPRTPQEFNAAGDGTTNDTTAVNTAVAAGREVELAGDFLVTSLTNTLGSEFKGTGRVLKAITGGTQQLNSRVDTNQHVFGQEYLAAFHANLLNQQITASILMSGDSTTNGDSTTSPYRPWEILKILGVERGHEITVTNAGHSGKDTSEWVSTYLTADLATTPKLYIVRWGVNDPYNGRTIQQYATSLRQGLAQIRASYNVSQMSVLLMAPNSTSDTPNGRDEKWYEQARLVCRQAARDYQCAFVDTYAIWRDSRGAANIWMDDPFGDGRAIHPKNVMNAWIYSKVAELLFPIGLHPRLFGAAYGTLSFATVPTSYCYGQTIYSSASGSTDFLVKNASVLTQRTADGAIYQRAWSNYDSGANNDNHPTPQLMERMGLAGSWYTPITAPPIDLTSYLTAAGTGWVPFAAGNVPRAKKTNNLVTLQGLIKSGTVTSGTTLFTLPAGYRPRNTVEVFLCATGPTGTTTPCVVHVNSTGVVQLQSAANTAFVSLSGISFEAGA